MQLIWLDIRSCLLLSTFITSHDIAHKWMHLEWRIPCLAYTKSLDSNSPMMSFCSRDKYRRCHRSKVWTLGIRPETGLQTISFLQLLLCNLHHILTFPTQLWANEHDTQSRQSPTEHDRLGMGHVQLVGLLKALERCLVSRKWSNLLTTYKQDHIQSSLQKNYYSQ